MARQKGSADGNSTHYADEPHGVVIIGVSLVLGSVIKLFLSLDQQHVGGRADSPSSPNSSTPRAA